MIRRCAKYPRGYYLHHPVRRNRSGRVGRVSPESSRHWRRLTTNSVEAADEGLLAKPSPYGRVDLLCFDELGDMQLDRRGDSFRCSLPEREETASVTIATTKASRAGQDLHRSAAVRRESTD